MAIPGAAASIAAAPMPQLTWGKESLPFDRFKAQPLPPGAARSPDDWAPVVVLAGRAAGIAGARARVGGGAAVRGRRRPGRVAPHARAASSERGEEVLRAVSHP